jgi:hypothetical protein
MNKRYFCNRISKTKTAKCRHWIHEVLNSRPAVLARAGNASSSGGKQ